jgi:mitochondrial fission protein ELM1
LRNRYLFMLATSDALVITRDSANMISEALPTNAPIFITGVSGSARLDRFVNNLAEQNRITFLTNASGMVEPARCVPTALEALSLEQTSRVSAVEREVDRVARQVLDRLWNSSLVK